MPKKITVILSDKAEKYFNEVAYSLDFGDGKVATNSQVVNYVIETLAMVETVVGDPVDFLSEQGVEFPLPTLK